MYNQLPCPTNGQHRLLNNFNKKVYVAQRTIDIGADYW